MIIDKMVPVGQSKVWQLLHDFYVNQGPSAWDEGLVPQTSTSNAYIADVYASIVAGFLKDNKQEGQLPPVILELGGGNGRFTWQFFQRFLRHHWNDEQDGAPNFTYVLTDAAQSNLDSWNASKRFQQIRDKGLLRFGILKINENPTIYLDGEQWQPQQLANRPLIIIANYIFDSLPADLYLVEGKELFQVYMSLDVDQSEGEFGKSFGFKDLKVNYEAQEMEQSATGVPLLDEIINEYVHEDRNFMVPVPKVGFQFLEQFTQHRKKPLLLLVGDLGYTEPANFPLKPPYIFDSYFASYSNFHVFAELFRRQGGGVQFQTQHDPDFCASAFWLPGTENADLSTTKLMAHQKLANFSPYDANEINDMLKKELGVVSYRQIFAWLRLSCFDPEVAQSCMGPLIENIHRTDANLNKEMLYQMYLEAYALYLPIGPTTTFDYTIAQLLLAIKYNDQALALLDESIQEFGRSPERLYIYALGLLRLERKDEAKIVLEEAIAAKPDFSQAMSVYEEHFSTAPAKTQNEVDFIAVSCLDKDFLPKALEVFQTEGGVLLKNIIPRAFMENLRTQFMARYEEWLNSDMGKANFVGNKRYTVPIRIQAPFNDPALFAPTAMMDVLTAHMGARPILNAYGAVVTYPGANSQHVHREHPLLYSRDEHNAGLPAHAVTVLVPMVDLDEHFGGTQFWRGTQNGSVNDEPEGPSKVVYTQMGDALVLDYRTFHGGMACTSETVRPVVYITYSLPWFRDTLAFESHDALAISSEELKDIPENYRDMFRFARKLN